MTRTVSGTVWFAAIAMALCTHVVQLQAESIRGQVVDSSGEGLEGVMVSAFDEERRQGTSVFSRADGSFVIDGLRDAEHSVRARLMGQRDEWLDDVAAEAGGATAFGRSTSGLESLILSMIFQSPIRHRIHGSCRNWQIPFVSRNSTFASSRSGS